MKSQAKVWLFLFGDIGDMILKLQIGSRPCRAAQTGNVYWSEYHHLSQSCKKCKRIGLLYSVIFQENHL